MPAQYLTHPESSITSIRRAVFHSAVFYKIIFHHKSLLAIMLSMLISGCTLFTTPKTTTDSHIGLEQWRAKGKLGFVAQKKARSVSFDWENNGELFDIKFYGTLGLGSASISKDKQGVHFSSSKHNASADTAEELLYDALGWSVPVSNLRYWIKGIAAPNLPITEQTFAEDGSIQTLEQQGWQIRYTRFYEQTPIKLPKKIIASRGHIKLTLVIKDWRI